MKKIFKKVVIVVAFALMFWGLATVNLITPTYAQTTGDTTILTVNGVGEVFMKPNEARISFGVETLGKTAKEAQGENNKIMNKVLDNLLKSDIAKEDITTQHFSVYPDYNYNQGKQELKGYRVNHEVLVKVKDLEKVGTIIDLGVSSGVNRVNHIDFYVADEKEARKEAMKKAVASAREKANILAKALDRSIIGIVHVREDGLYHPIPFRQNYSYGVDNDTSLKEAAFDIQINPGELKIQANVQIDFKIK